MNWDKAFEPFKALIGSGFAEIILGIFSAFILILFLGSPFLLIASFIANSLRNKG